MAKIDERNVDPITEMLRLVKEGNLTFDRWGFKETYRSVTENRLFYDSEWCRIKLVWGGWDPSTGNSISIYYGRLHAPSEDVTMNWNGEECHAWHRFEHPLHFLDGRSPADAAEMNYSTPLTNKYYDDEFSKKFDHCQPEWLMKMHMEVWTYYGDRLFELFDLRKPQSWENYRKFLKEFYDIKGRLPFIQPPLDKVC